MQDRDVKEIFSAIKMLKDKMDKVVDRIENVEKQIKELKKEDLAQLDPYSKENFIIKGDYIELKEPVGNIKMIERWVCRKTMTWEETFEYAKNLRIGGFNDWRVPTREELIVIERMKNVCGIEKCDDWFWSSSTLSDNINYAWLVGFTYGNVLRYHKSNNHYVRCVR